MKEPFQETKHQVKRRKDDLVKDRANETYLLPVIIIQYVVSLSLIFTRILVIQSSTFAETNYVLEIK